MRIFVLLAILLMPSASSNVISSAADFNVDSLLNYLHRIEGDWSAARMILAHQSDDHHSYAIYEYYPASIRIADAPPQFIELTINSNSDTDTIETSRIEFDTTAGSWIYRDHREDRSILLGEPSLSPELISFPFANDNDDNHHRLSILCIPPLIDRCFELRIEERTPDGWWLAIWMTHYKKRQ